MAAIRRALFTDHPWPDLAIERSILAAAGIDLLDAAGEAPSELARLACEADAIGVCWAPLPADLIARCRRCRIIARFGVGRDNIAVDAATAAGIPVTCVPDYCVGEVADHTIALLLALVRCVPAFDGQVKAGLYAPNAFLPRRLNGMTLGLVGLGRIGREVADRASAFGMNVLAATPSGRDHGGRVRPVPLAELLAASDVVSLHLPLTPRTRHLIDAVALSRMKSTASLINTSRGPLVDPAALLAALDAGRLAGAGLDVFETEPPRPDDPLPRHPKVIATPHVAFRSAESLVELRTRGARQIVDALAGRRPEHLVNPEVWTDDES